MPAFFVAKRGLFWNLDSGHRGSPFFRCPFQVQVNLRANEIRISETSTAPITHIQLQMNLSPSGNMFTKVLISRFGCPGFLFWQFRGLTTTANAYHSAAHDPMNGQGFRRMCKGKTNREVHEKTKNAHIRYTAPFGLYADYPPYLPPELAMHVPGYMQCRSWSTILLHQLSGLVGLLEMLARFIVWEIWYMASCLHVQLIASCLFLAIAIIRDIRIN